MPPAKKINLLPPQLREWLQDALKDRGFGGYEAITEELNSRLEEEGLELRFGKSAVHLYGQELKDYVTSQREAHDEIRAVMEEVTLRDEVDVTSALFQQLVTVQWRLQKALADPDGLPDPRGMKDLTTALNNLIRSTDLRDGIKKAVYAEQSERLNEAVADGQIDRAAAEAARKVMGFVS